MSENMFLNLLLLCGILSQGIIETFADENINGTSDILVRQKRVISRVPGEDQKIPIQSVPYVVQIKHNMRISCTGSILSRHVVITEPLCVRYAASEYHVASNSARSDRGTIHNVTGIRRHIPNQEQSPWHGIALVIVYPPFLDIDSTKPIPIHTALLVPGTMGTVSGWGFNYRASVRGTEHPKNLRSIRVPILPHLNCVHVYRPRNIVISDKDICTYHSDKQCGHSDGGAPLVIDGFLVGVHLKPQDWISDPINCQLPDVFAVLQDPYYKQWIDINIHGIEMQLS